MGMLQILIFLTRSYNNRLVDNILIDISYSLRNRVEIKTYIFFNIRQNAAILVGSDKDSLCISFVQVKATRSMNLAETFRRDGYATVRSTGRVHLLEVFFLCLPRCMTGKSTSIERT